MRPRLAHLAAGLAALLVGRAEGVRAQGYRLRLDTRVQAAAYRGVRLDSIPVADTVPTPGGGGPRTSDGYAVQCTAGRTYCTFYRPGDERQGGPLTAAADFTVWGLGVPGLSVHGMARVGADLGDSDVWPGTDPSVQVLEGFAEYAVAAATARAGRQTVSSRLGTAGFDGVEVRVRRPRPGLEAQGYLGWGLARGIALPVSSPALNPLDDFQPRGRQVVAGASAAWRADRLDLRVDYQREVDPGADHFVSERVGVQGAWRPATGLRLDGGGDYDIAAGWWGSAEATLGYTARAVRGTLGVRRYRPHFDLWTIWGVFSPVPYRATTAAVTVFPHSRIDVRGRYELYEFDAAEAATPLFDAEEDGWRGEVGATVRPLTGWTLDAGFRADYGPGAASAGVEASVTYGPSDRLAVTVFGSTFTRPLEFRFNEAEVRAYGVDARFSASSRVRVSFAAARYEESHRRPDAAAFDWDQLRVSAGVALLFGSDADLRGLPPAIRILPGGRAAR